MNSELLEKAIGRILSERYGKKVTVTVTTCRNCTHRSHCIESDRGPCKDYEDMYGNSKDQINSTPGRKASDQNGKKQRKDQVKQGKKAYG